MYQRGAELAKEVREAVEGGGQGDIAREAGRGQHYGKLLCEQFGLLLGSYCIAGRTQYTLNFLLEIL